MKAFRIGPLVFARREAVEQLLDRNEEWFVQEQKLHRIAEIVNASDAKHNGVAQQVRYWVQGYEPE